MTVVKVFYEYDGDIEFIAESEGAVFRYLQTKYDLEVQKHYTGTDAAPVQNMANATEYARLSVTNKDGWNDFLLYKIEVIA